jgi:ferritin-like metal-binding protein YciE
MGSIKTAEDAFEHELADIYDAEHRFLEAQKEMSAQADDQKLRTMIVTHMKETEEQIKKLEQVFEEMGSKPEKQACKAAQGLVAEGASVMKESEAPAKDSLIAGAVARVEHYEIAAYTGLVEAARTMGQSQVAKLLEANLKQEERTAQLIEKESPRLLKQMVKAGA